MQIVEAVCNVAADLDVLALIHANRNEIGLVQQNVCRHQNRIGKQTDIDVVRMLGGFVLELGHAGSLAEHGEAVEHPRQLRMRGHMALDEQNALFRVQTAGNVLRDQFKRCTAKRRRLLPDRNGVLIDHAVNAVVLLLQDWEIADSTQIVTQRQLAGRLHAGENRFLLVIAHVYTSLA